MYQRKKVFKHFLLGLLVADFLYSFYFYINGQSMTVLGYSFAPSFFGFFSIVDILIIAMLIKLIIKDETGR